MTRVLTFRLVHRFVALGIPMAGMVGCLMLGGLAAHAATLTVVPVGKFGEPLRACVVEALHRIDSTGEKREFSSGSRELRISSVPLGKYDVTVRCDEGEIRRQVTVAHNQETVLMVWRDLILITDHKKPELTVELEESGPQSETWWIRLIGLYNNKDYSSVFLPETGEAVIVDPEPGSYLVIVQPRTGYLCSREVDLVYGTTQWNFNPSGCSFRLDRFAHIVTEEDKRNSKHGDWYQQVRIDKDLVLRQLRDAAEKQ